MAEADTESAKRLRPPSSLGTPNSVRSFVDDIRPGTSHSGFGHDNEAQYESHFTAISFADQISSPLAEFVEIPHTRDFWDDMSESGDSVLLDGCAFRSESSSAELSIKLRPTVLSRKMSILQLVDSDIQDSMKEDDKFTRIASDIAGAETGKERLLDTPPKLRKSYSTRSIRSFHSTFQSSMSQSSTSVAATLNIHVASGYVCDYLERLRTRAERVKSPFVNQIKIMLGPRDVALRSRAAAEGLDVFGLGSSLYKECIDFICQEKAIDAMLRDATLFWKCRGHPDWECCGRETLTSCTRKIANFTRQSICLRDEVSNWLLCKKLLADAKKKERIRFDGAVERFDRLQEFWKHVHMDTRKTDNLLRALPDSRPQTTTSYGSRPLSPLLLPGVSRPPSRHLVIPSSLPSLPVSDTGSDSRPPSRLSTTAKPNVGFRGAQTISLPELLRLSARDTQGLAVPGQRPDSKCWKTRASRSRCTYGLKPVWPQEPTPMHSAATSSRASTAATAELAARKGWAYWVDEMEEGSCRTKRSTRSSAKNYMGRWWAQGEDLSLFLKPKHIPPAKCKSLPSLRTNSLRPPSPSSTSFCTFSDTASLLQTAEETCRARSAFVEPWRTDDSSMHHLNSAPKQYLRACQGNRTNPKPLPFVTGHSPKLGAVERGLSDRDLDAVTEVARDVLMEDVELQGNSMLTGKALLPFLSTLGGSPVTALNLRRVVHVGQAACMEALVTLLTNEESTGVSRLCHLNLSSIPVAFQWHLRLCQAISAHPSLTDVHLADTGLGNSQAKDCIGALLSSSALQVLDIGWNCFSTEVLTHLGGCIVASNTLKSLSLANCSSSMALGEVSPVMCFAEFLAKDRELTHLDLSLNRIDYRGALIIEDALSHHKRLSNLVISSNPLGVLGMRSLLRLLAQDQSGLQNFVCDGCSSGKYPPADEQHPIYTATNPGGRYVLDLEQPYCRALLRMLYRTCERFELSPETCFKHMKFKGRNSATYHHPEKDQNGTRMVPESGRVVVTFSIERAMDGALRDVNEDDFRSFLRLHNSIMRLSPGFKKLVPMFAQWKRLNGLAQEQDIFVNALAKDFALTYPHVKCLSENSAGAASNIVWQLLPCIVGGEGQVFLSTQLAPTLGDFVTLLQKAHILLHMNVENPTGHYKLDLENVTCYAVAEWLMLLDRWEAGIALKHGRVDTSQKGNRSQVRNETYQGHALSHSMAEWILPSWDVLEFDYCSTKRAPIDAAVLDKVSLSNLMVVMQQSEVPGYMMAEALRKISHHIYLRSINLREILGIFSEKELIGQVCVMFINRIVDMWNEKVFRVRFEDPEFFLHICNQVGFCTFFPFVQPEQTQFVLDFKYHDQRLAANILINIAIKERIQNLIDLEMVYPDGNTDPLPVGLKLQTWQDAFDKMPLAGVFKASYRCAPEDHRLAVRLQSFEHYGFWGVDADAEVMWWADVAHVPTDVILFLCFIVRRFHSVDAAYRFMLDDDGNTKLPLRVFEEKLREMKFMKFKESVDTSENDRVKTVFRYLDASHEGLLSEEEFNVLDLFWKEVNLCISEFTKFLERTLGDDYREMWEFFDEDGSGSIEYSEWMDTAKRLGYFGPVSQIFYFMDEDGDGTISVSEFLMLERFLKSSKQQDDA